MGAIFSVETTEPQQAIEITSKVQAELDRAGVESGFCHVMVLHSTASIVINENADPNIGIDVINALEGAVPTQGGWLHDRLDGNAHSHIKAAILGPSEMIPIQRGRLLLGKWQEIILIEFDGPRERQVSVQFIAQPQQT